MVWQEGKVGGSHLQALTTACLAQLGKVMPTLPTHHGQDSWGLVPPPRQGQKGQGGQEEGGGGGLALFPKSLFPN